MNKKCKNMYRYFLFLSFRNLKKFKGIQTKFTFVYSMLRSLYYIFQCRYIKQTKNYLVFVRVEFEGKFSVGLLNIVFTAPPLHPQHTVVVLTHSKINQSINQSFNRLKLKEGNVVLTIPPVLTHSKINHLINQ